MNPTTETPSRPARYLNDKLVTVIATDYGGYAVTFPVPQLSQAAAVPAARDGRYRWRGSSHDNRGDLTAIHHAEVTAA